MTVKGVLMMEIGIHAHSLEHVIMLQYNSSIKINAWYIPVTHGHGSSNHSYQTLLVSNEKTSHNYMEYPLELETSVHCRRKTNMHN